MTKNNKNTLFLLLASILFFLATIIYALVIKSKNNELEGQPISFLIQKGNIPSKIFYLDKTITGGMIKERCYFLNALSKTVNNKIQCHKSNDIKNNNVKKGKTIVLKDANSSDDGNKSIEYKYTDYPEIVAVFDLASYQGKTSVVARLYGVKNFQAYEIQNKIHLDNLQKFLDGLPTGLNDIDDYGPKKASQVSEKEISLFY